MKNLLVIALALVTITTTAQERKRDAQKGDNKERMEMRQDRTPEETAQLNAKKMTLKLDLDAKQQAQVENILLADAKERKANRKEFMAMKGQEGGEKVSKEEHLKMQNDRLDHQIEMKKKLKSVLNADQYAKLEKMQEKRQGKKGQKFQLKK